MKHRERVIYTALGLLLVGSLLFYFAFRGQGQGIGIFGMAAFVVSLVEMMVLLVIGAVLRLGKFGTTDRAAPSEDVLDDNRPIHPVDYRRRAADYFLAAGLVVLIGGSLCFGGLAL